jgi:hypothetical protein
VVERKELFRPKILKNYIMRRVLRGGCGGYEEGNGWGTSGLNSIYYLINKNQKLDTRLQKYKLILVRSHHQISCRPQKGNTHMKLVIRALVLGIAVSGLAASAITAHMGNNAATANNQMTAVASQSVVAAMPMPVCPAHCGIQSGMHK